MNLTTNRERGELARPVFIISTGRSGSTLLQRLLNCHQDLIIWGEHFGFLGSALSAAAQMYAPQQKLYPLTPDTNKGPELLIPSLSSPVAAVEWANPCSASEYLVQLRSFTENYFCNLLADGKRWGFKEILYVDLRTLKGLSVLYPKSTIFFMERDIGEVVRSKIHAFIKINTWRSFTETQKQQKLLRMIDEVKLHYRNFRVTHEEIIERSLIVRYEDLIADHTKYVRRCLDTAGLDADRFDFNLAKSVAESIITRTKQDNELLNQISKLI